MFRSRYEPALAAAWALLAVLVLACSAFSHVDVTPHRDIGAATRSAGGAPTPNRDQRPASDDDTREHCTVSLLSACLTVRSTASTIVLAAFSLLAAVAVLLVAPLRRRALPLVRTLRRTRPFTPSLPALCVSRT